VGSTDLAAQIGDGPWRHLLESHNALVRRELRRFGGHEVDTSGDGFLATFQQPAPGIRCACALIQQVDQLGLRIRVGIHTGEIELLRYDVAGLAVHIGARIASKAGPNEVLVSNTTRELALGSGFSFQDKGHQQLKGVPGDWRLYSATSPSAPGEVPAKQSWVRRLTATRGRRIAVAAGIVGLAAAGVIGTLVALNGHRSASGSRAGGSTPPLPPGEGIVTAVSVSSGTVRPLATPFRDLEKVALSPNGDQIAFVSAGQIFLMNVDGSNRRQLTTDPSGDGSPAWSPDGQQIVYTRKTAKGRQVEVMAADGSDQRRVTAGDEADTSPAWSSPRIVYFTRHVGDERHIFQVRVDGSGLKDIDPGNNDDHQPTSPFRRRILLIRDTQGLGHVFRLSLVTGSVTNLTGFSSNDSDPAWSPDGRRFAFARQDHSGWHIWIMNGDGTNARRLTSGPFSDRYPSWSRDSATIYFARTAE